MSDEKKEQLERYWRNKLSTGTNGFYGLAPIKQEGGYIVSTTGTTTTVTTATTDTAFRDISVFDDGEVIFNENTGSTYLKVNDGVLLKLPHCDYVDLTTVESWHVLTGIGNLENLTKKLKGDAEYDGTEGVL